MHDLLYKLKLRFVIFGITTSRRSKLYIFLSLFFKNLEYVDILIKRLLSINFYYEVKSSRNHVWVDIDNFDFASIFKISYNKRSGGINLYKSLENKLVNKPALVAYSKVYPFYYSSKNNLIIEKWIRPEKDFEVTDIPRLSLFQTRVRMNPCKHFHENRLKHHYDYLKHKLDEYLELSYCHGDLVASNVIVSDGKCVLIDFSDATIDYTVRDASTLCASILAGEPRINDVEVYVRNLNFRFIKTCFDALFPGKHWTLDMAFEAYLFGLLCKIGDLGSNSHFYDYYLELYNKTVSHQNVRVL
jgi:hypothetical protein